MSTLWKKQFQTEPILSPNSQRYLMPLTQQTLKIYSLIIKSS